MRISVVICSYNRPAVLDDTVLSVLRQTQLPEEILIVTPSRDDVLARTLERDRVRLVLSARGLTIQRNTALASLKETDLIAFLDDDMELTTSYLESMNELFEMQPDIIVASGRLLADGGRGAAVSRLDAQTLCQSVESRKGSVTVATKPLDYGYGCNMMVRAAAALQNRFDEKLSLYAWLEDSDFSFHCTRRGNSPVINISAQCVHLGWRGGRISGLKMGYSQIVNPFYLWKKARVFTLRHILIQYWARCFVANVVGVMIGASEEDRLNRLRGNLVAAWHLIQGRCDPMIIKELS